MSEVKVNKISPRSGTAFTLGDSGDTFTVPSGAGLTLTDSTLLLPTTITSTTEVKTNKISPATGVAFTLGDSGDTFTVPAGATIVNSGTATGFGDAPGLVLLLSETGTSAATVDISSTEITSTYDNYKIYFSGRAGTDNTGLQVQLSTNNGSSYITSGYSYSNQDIGNGNSTADVSASQFQFNNQAYLGNNTNEGFNGVFDLLSPLSTTIPTMMLSCIGGADNSDAFFYQTGMGRRNDGTQAHNSFKFFQSSGSYSEYTLQVYGVKK